MLSTLKESLRIALLALRSHPLRTGLIIMTNAIAVFALVMLVSILQGLEGKLRELFSMEGADILFVTPQPPIGRLSDIRKYATFPELTLREARFLEEHLRNLDLLVPTVSTRGAVRYRDRSLQATVVARTANYPRIENIKLYAGRHFTVFENEHRRPVAVIGWRVYRELFPDGKALNRWIWVGNRSFQVVGVIGERGSMMGEDLDSMVWVPLHTWIGGQTRIDYIMMRPKAGAVAELQEETRYWLRRYRKLRPDQEDNFGLLSTEGFLEIYRQATQSLRLALIGIVGLGLVVGGIILMNILLMSVAERTNEIGLRKAVGARPWDIAIQFLWESMILATMGGAAGSLAGAGLSSVVSDFAGLPWAFPYWSVAMGLLLTASAGILFGFYPARRAARLDPVVALQYEHG